LFVLGDFVAQRGRQRSLGRADAQTLSVGGETDITGLKLGE